MKSQAVILLARKPFPEPKYELNELLLKISRTGVQINFIFNLGSIVCMPLPVLTVNCMLVVAYT